jgi:hypothetical protein
MEPRPQPADPYRSAAKPVPAATNNKVKIDSIRNLFIIYSSCESDYSSLQLRSLTSY